MTEGYYFLRGTDASGLGFETGRFISGDDAETTGLILAALGARTVRLWRGPRMGPRVVPDAPSRRDPAAPHGPLPLAIPSAPAEPPMTEAQVRRIAREEITRVAQRSQLNRLRNTGP